MKVLLGKNSRRFSPRKERVIFAVTNQKLQDLRMRRTRLRESRLRIADFTILKTLRGKRFELDCPSWGLRGSFPLAGLNTSRYEAYDKMLNLRFET